MSDTLNTCGCCEGVRKLTPASVENRPGLSALAYRVGTHARFKQSLLAALARQAGLRDLTTRDDDDPSIALLDAWATVLDVLSFYQERIANEGYLRTATERRSVLELARRIGYELRPGVAAGTYLAFTLETAPGSPGTAVIDKGTRAQSLPGQDEVPQPFETVEEIEAKAAWNAMPARQTERVVPGFGERTLYLEGTTTNLRPGDALVLIGEERANDPGNENWDFRRVKTLKEDREAGLTLVELDRGLGSFAPFVRPAANPEVYALRRRAALFGHNAPDWRAMPDGIKRSYLGLGPNDPIPSRTEWPDFSIQDVAEQASTIHLDAVYEGIVPDSWIVLATPEYAEVYQVEHVAEDARTGFTLAAKTTRLTLDGEHLLEEFDDRLRDTVVFAESEWLPQTERPIDTPVEGATVVLVEAVEGLTEGRLLIVSGREDATGEAVSEVATLKQADAYDGTTRLTFIEALTYTYRRDSVTVNANVARATHGETKSEVLGSGDGSQPFQRFTLKQKPLTYISAATASGTESTLEVRVNDVLWDEVSTLYDQPSGKRAYVTRHADDGSATVLFGDGKHGARLPTGAENVKAAYRVGTGLDGMVDAGQISLLMTRPLGVKSVSNPLAPTGGADPEALDDARRNAPLTVLTLDRIVSVQDYEDFTRAFAGIGKAQATLLWDGERRFVHLTVAGAEGSAVPDDSDLYANLLAAIDAARHPEEQVQVDTYGALTFGLDAGVLIDAAYVAENVLAAMKTALVEAFSFARRSFGQSVTASEVLAVMQQVPGVVAVDLDALDGLDPFAHPRVSARVAIWEGQAAHPAQLLTVDPAAITLTQKTP